MTRRRVGLLFLATIVAIGVWIGLHSSNATRSGASHVETPPTASPLDPNAADNLTVIVRHRIGNTALAHVPLEVALTDRVLDLGAPRTDTSGRFHARLLPGDYFVHAGLGSATARAAFTIMSQGRTEVILTIEGFPCVVIRGVVRGEDGHGVPNISVIATADSETLPPDFANVSRNERVMKTKTDGLGNYELAGTLMPASYEIVAVGSLIERGAAEWPVVRVEHDKAHVERSFDLLVRFKVFVNLAGRVMTPDHQPCEGARVVVMLQALNDKGEVVSGREKVASTDAQGRFCIRATSPHVGFKILHARYRTASLQMETGLQEFADKTRPLPDFILQPKTTRIEARFEEEATGKAVAGEWRLIETSSEFGNGYFTIQSDGAGRVSFLVEAGTPYTIQRQGYKLVSMKGCLVATLPRSLQFPEQGGELELLVRRLE